MLQWIIPVIGTLNFNPHSRTESDWIWTHCKSNTMYFNPHSRTESDENIGILHQTTITFQSTLSHGE